jgi:hypothetical protein
MARPRPIAAALAVAALAPWVALALLSIPSGDDLCYFGTSRAVGWSAAQLEVYQGHSGRFVATALLTGLGELIDRTAGGLPGPFPVLPLLAIGAFLWLSWRSLALLLPELAAPVRAIAATLSAALLIATLPTPAELLYWGAGMASYLPLALLLWHLTLRVAAAIAGGKPPGAGEAALLAALAFLAAGTQELGAPLLVLLLGAWAAAGRRQGWPGAALLRLAAIAAAASVAFVVLYAAPGNDARLGAYPGSRDLLRALPLGAVDTLIFLALRMAAAPALLGGLALAWLAAARGERRASPALWRLLPALWILGCLGAEAVSRYATAHGLPPRAQNLLYLMGAPALLAAVTWHGRARGADILAGWRPGRRRAAAAAALLACAAGAGEWRGLYEAAVTAPRFTAEYRARLAQLAAAPPGATVAVTPVRQKTTLLPFAELAADPEDWRNRCAARYFRLGAVVLAPPGS